MGSLVGRSSCCGGFIFSSDRRLAFPILWVSFSSVFPLEWFLLRKLALTTLWADSALGTPPGHRAPPRKTARSPAVDIAPAAPVSRSLFYAKRLKCCTRKDLYAARKSLDKN